MRDAMGVPMGFFTGALVGCIGSNVLPASAAAAGGTLGVMGACALTGAATFFGGSFLLAATLENATNAWSNGDYGLSSAWFALSAAEIGGLAFLAAGTGSLCFNLAIEPLFFCALCGTGPMLAPILIAAAVAGLVALGRAVCTSDNAFSLN